MLKRYGTSSVAAFVLLIVFLYLLQFVVAVDYDPLNEVPDSQGNFFSVRLISDHRPIESEQHEMEPPPLFEEFPIDLSPVEPDGRSEYGALGWGQFEPPILKLAEPQGGWVREGDYYPLFTTDPYWPEIALESRIEGFVIVQFDVTEEGTVENPVVIEAKPPGIFEVSVMRVLLQFKYKPKILNGQPVRVTGVEHRFVYQQDEQL